MSSNTERRAEILPGHDVKERFAVTFLEKEAGFLGRFFGTAPNAPTNIGGLVVVLFIVICIVALFMPLKMQAADVLGLALPVITLVLGYLFGKVK